MGVITMSNLRDETLGIMRDNGKTPEDVRWIGDGNIRFTWDEFEAIANFGYDDGYGGQKIAKDLMVVGGDWWLERHEYDGAEWWEFKAMPSCPDRHEVPRRLKGFNSWSSLSAVNADDDDLI